jgi:hypothetical protein
VQRAVARLDDGSGAEKLDVCKRPHYNRRGHKDPAKKQPLRHSDSGLVSSTEKAPVKM